jgi:anti-sigma B factor antagonist
VRRTRQLSLELRRIGDASVVSARGDIDLSTVEKAGAAIDAAREEQRGGGGLFLDLRKVGFMDTSGLRLVIAERRRADAEGYRFAVFPGPPKVQRLFEIAGLAGDELLFADPATVLGVGEAG